MHTLFPLTITDQMRASVDFYRELLGFEVIADVGWYVQMQDPTREWVQVAFIEPGHESVPASHQQTPAGVAITVEVADVDAIHERARAMGLAMLVTLRSEEWGQRHFITEDPAGLLLDVVQPIPPSPEFLRAMATRGST
jgi:catechol 2,3-dioxygenase-like lactoylglutathione lyase family enzyme